jgi:ATP/maltotriose-dependent transcriptional regulator MalT
LTSTVVADRPTSSAAEALAAGRWDEARAAFEATLAAGDSAEARLGLATALWWLGENRASVEQCTAAYSLFRRRGDTDGAVGCALWLGITYKANFANLPAANGWIARAQRLLEPIDPGPAHASLWITRAYRMADLGAAERLTRQALDLATAIGDVDLELIAASQLGLIAVGKGEVAHGLALIDEAMAAVLGGEACNLDTVVYTCCDMLNACELAGDAERATQWCKVADQFVATYGCPFLYAECRILYGGVLTAIGRWAEAEHELLTGMRTTRDVCPGLHNRALTRLANLRIRQGRLEEAERLLGDAGGVAEAEVALSAAALMLARGDGDGASRLLEHRWRTLKTHRMRQAVALDVLVDAHLAAADVFAANAAASRLLAIAASAGDVLTAVAAAAAGRVAAGTGATDTAIGRLEDAASRFADLGMPFETARARFDLARLLAPSVPDLAVAHARSALDGFTRLGAALEADRVAAFLRTHGVVARTGPKGVGALTTREQEVLRLLAHGLSNPEIASRLYVSRRTAAHHVSSILAKLDVANRAAAAAYARDVLG